MRTINPVRPPESIAQTLQLDSELVSSCWTALGTESGFPTRAMPALLQLHFFSLRSLYFVSQ